MPESTSPGLSLRKARLNPGRLAFFPLAVEVINNAGTLQPTGRKMPSQQAVDAIIRAVFGGLNVLFDPL
ncbi:TPA: hypothetical protein MIG70_21620, partial [Klebsiella pneumoniae]|nr:hypothetical protein [Klebsiella pneumoniae]